MAAPADAGPPEAGCTLHFAGGRTLVVRPARAGDAAWEALLAAQRDLHPGVPIHVDASGRGDPTALVVDLARRRRDDQSLFP